MIVGLIDGFRKLRVEKTHIVMIKIASIRLLLVMMSRFKLTKLGS